MKAPNLETTEERKPSPLARFKPAIVPLAIFACGIVNGAHGNPALLAVAVVSGCIALARPYRYGKRANRKVKNAFLALLGAMVFTSLNLFATPARAQFFQGAEQFFNTTFSSSNAAIPIVFNTLRALYIIYLAVAFIGVFNSVRQDEDWVAAARTPILVVITVTLADILTKLITG